MAYAREKASHRSQSKTSIQTKQNPQKQERFHHNNRSEHRGIDDVLQHHGAKTDD